tara:strand:+ start:186 stop:1607 length:1422 start_codon:yes stop_codon:yes gene_type:complete
LTVATEKLPLKPKLFYGFGSVAYGIKDNGFATFLLFYYEQVVGLDAGLVGLAIALALFADAFVDPAVGQLSDRTRTTIGRRHPWLYAASLPIVAAWLLLWHPPELSQGWLFAYLFVTAMTVRMAFSAFEVPALALLPELSNDYHDRTVIMRFRFLFGWTGGLFIMFLAYALFFVPSEDYPVGLLNRDGYEKYAVFGACIMLVAVLVSAIGTHKRIVSRYRDTRDFPKTAETLKQIFETFRYRPFLLLMLAGIFAFTNQWLVFALSPYLFTHVWEFRQPDFTAYSILLFGAAVLAFLLVTPLSMRLGKAKAASLLTLTALTVGTLPYWLRMAHGFPEPGDPVMIPVLFALLLVATASSIAAMILTMSMIADVTDQHEHDTSKRSEGLFSSGMFFMQKVVNGIGILMASQIIAFIGLPKQAEPGTVDGSVVDNLALIYVVTATLLALVGAWAYTKFPLGEKDHELRLAAKAVRPN